MNLSGMLYFFSALLIPVPVLFPGRLQQPVSIYLSFDDGPGVASGELDRLALADSVPLTVFLIGRNVFSNDSLYRSFLRYRSNPFIRIGNHSYTHADGRYHHYYEDAAGVMRDFDRNQDTLQLTDSIGRMPGRNCWRVGHRKQDDIVNGREAADSLAAHGYRLFGWDLEWRADTLTGYSCHTAEQMLVIAEKIIRERRVFRPGNLVILLHEQEMREEGFRKEVSNFIRLVKTDNHSIFRFINGYPF